MQVEQNMFGEFDETSEPKACLSKQLVKYDIKYVAQGFVRRMKIDFWG